MTHLKTIVSNIDIAPTLLHLASGIAPDARTTPQPMDGLSIISQVAAQAKGQPRTVFAEIGKDRAAVNAEWKYIQRNVEGFTGGSKRCRAPADVAVQAKAYPDHADALQLYDLVKDPMEQTNVLQKTGYDVVVKEMQTALSCHVQRTLIGQFDYTAVECKVDIPTTNTVAGTIRTGLNGGGRSGGGSRWLLWVVVGWQWYNIMC